MSGFCCWLCFVRPQIKSCELSSIGANTNCKDNVILKRNCGSQAKSITSIYRVKDRGWTLVGLDCKQAGKSALSHAVRKLFSIEYLDHPGDDNGRLLTLHGRIAHFFASEACVTNNDDSPPRITLTGVVQERWFKCAQFVMETKLSTDIGSMTLRFDEKVTNRTSNEKEFQILYHANFAKQLLEEGSRLHGTVAEIQPFNDYATKTLKSWNVYAAPAEEVADEKIYQIKPVLCLFQITRRQATYIAHCNESAIDNYPMT